MSFDDDFVFPDDQPMTESPSRSATRYHRRWRRRWPQPSPLALDAGAVDRAVNVAA